MSCFSVAIFVGALASASGAYTTANGGKPATCGEVKQFYKDKNCCGAGSDDTTAATKIAFDSENACAYHFAKPACSHAEPQSPRDLSTAAPGDMIPKATVLTFAQTNQLPLANVHFHLGAEHKSDSYNDATDADAWDAAAAGRRLLDEDDATYARRLAANPRPGFMCSQADLTEEEKNPDYTWEHCGSLDGQVKPVIGKSYEVHYVHSSAATIEEPDDIMNDGLGEAAHGKRQLNPQVAVQAQVFQIVNGAAPARDPLDIADAWLPDAITADRVMYAGSTTGPSHNNQVCSPYAITWHVDKVCKKIHASDWDNMCKIWKAKGLAKDLTPHGSRILCSKDIVVRPGDVKPLA